MARDWIRFNTNFEVVGGYLVCLDKSNSGMASNSSSRPLVMPTRSQVSVQVVTESSKP